MYLIAGNTKVPVADCTKRSYSAHPKEEWMIEQFLHYWRTEIQERRPPVTDSNNERQILYLKDWHYAQLVLLYIGILVITKTFRS